MVNLAQQGVFLVQRLGQCRIAVGDVVAQLIHGLGQTPDLQRRILGLYRTHRVAAACIDGGNPVQIVQPADYDPFGG